jgi:nucleotide sugar dehydrogenase
MVAVFAKYFDGEVLGVDVDAEWVEALRSGRVKMVEEGLFEYLSAYRDKIRFETLSEVDFSRVGHVVVAIGVDINSGFCGGAPPDYLTPLYKVVETAVEGGWRGGALVLRPTVPIGTTRALAKYIEERWGLRPGVDYYLAYVPERLVEGRGVFEEETLPKVVGCLEERSCEEAAKLFNKFPSKVVTAIPPEKAELVKLIDNSWRNYRFAFANEVALIAEKLGLDAHEVIDLAKLDYPRNADLPKPGPASGYCLGKDPYALCGFKTLHNPPLAVIARMFNDDLYSYLARVILKLAGGGPILILGLSYKADVDDYRMSHAIEILKRVAPQASRIVVHDPYLGLNRYTDARLLRGLGPAVFYTADLEEALNAAGGAALAVISTPHTVYKKNINRIIENVRLVYDLYGLTREVGVRSPKVKVLGSG